MFFILVNKSSAKVVILGLIAKYLVEKLRKVWLFQ